MHFRRQWRRTNGLQAFLCGAMTAVTIVYLATRFKCGQDTEGLVAYQADHPIVWVGGVPRSGTTLFRVMLDAHPNIRCGEETRLIPIILNLHSKMLNSEKELERLQEAKITDTVLNRALGSYILSIIEGHGKRSTRYCNKDPFSMRHMLRIHTIFPNSKFILMVRDVRATVYSLIYNKVKIRNFNTQTYRNAILEWNRAMSMMYHQCVDVGPNVCMRVYYEQLVLHPEEQMRNILKFINEPWNENVINHEKNIGMTNGASLSRTEMSTSQVIRAINLDGLTKWMGQVPMDVLSEIDQLAPMLKVFGYRTHIEIPGTKLFYYGRPDDVILERYCKSHNITIDDLEA